MSWSMDPALSVMDDILVAASSVEEHDAILHKVVERATSYNLKLNFNKCHICQPAVPYMGHLITATATTDNGLKPDPVKIKAVQHMSQPTYKEGVCHFLGYLSKFIPK